MVQYILSTGEVPMDDAYDPDHEDPANARKVATIGKAIALIEERLPQLGLLPAGFGDFELIDGIVGQELVVTVPLTGTPPHVLSVVVDPDLGVGGAKIVSLPGGSKELHLIAPFEGNTTNVTKTVQLTVWNNHPTTRENSPISITKTWTVKPAANANASWGSTNPVLPGAEVGAAYEFYAADVVGDGPFTFARSGGTITLAMLQSAGLSIRAGTVVDVKTTKVILGTPLPGSETLLDGGTLELSVTGATGVPATLMFPAGINIRRKPGISLQSIPTITTATGSIDLSSYLVGDPAASIVLNPGETLPGKFSFLDGVLSWAGLTTGDNATSEGIDFTVSNGYHADVAVTYSIKVQITAGSLEALPGAIASFSKDGRANTGIDLASLADNTEVTVFRDIAGEVINLNAADGAAATHSGALWRSSGSYLEIRNGVGETPRRSIGLFHNIGLGPKYLALRMRMPDTQEAGDVIVAVLGPSALFFNKDGGGGGLDVFKLKTGAVSFSSMAIDAIGNFINLLLYIGGANQVGFAYAADGTIDADTTLQTVAGIDSAWDRIIFAPSYATAADLDLQCMAFGLGLPS